MPRFYFDVREGARFIPDDEGLEFANLDAAEHEAACTAAEIDGTGCRRVMPVRSQSKSGTSTASGC